MLSSKLPLSVFVGRAGNNLLNKATAAGISSISFCRRSIATTKMVQIKVSSFSILPKIKSIRRNSGNQEIRRLAKELYRPQHNLFAIEIRNFPKKKNNSFTSVPTFCNIFRLRNGFEGDVRIYIFFVSIFNCVHCMEWHFNDYTKRKVTKYQASICLKTRRQIK